MSDAPALASPRSSRPFWHWLWRLPLYLATGLALLYVFGAIVHDGPFVVASTANKVLASLWLVLTLILAKRARPGLRRTSAIAICIAMVMIPWSFIRPSNDRDWKPEFSRTCWVSFEGDQITFHEFRDFSYPGGVETPHWEDRSFTLSKLQGIDLFFDAFGGRTLAHPILSFDFGDDGHACMSVETRRETHEAFSTFGGLYKMFELQYMFGSEADFIGVRTQVRHEPVYLYRLTADAEQARELLLESVGVMNQLKEYPRFYNVITHNCTTSLRAQQPAENRAPFDWRMLVNGRLDEYLFEKGAFETGGLAFEALREQALINPVTDTLTDRGAFSSTVRRERVGYSD